MGRWNGLSAATLSDVARHAGVSLATASRALNGSARVVRPDLVERVRASAHALDYRADPSAQAMVRGRTAVVGLLVTTISDPYFSSIAAGVVQAAEQRGLVVTLAATGGDPARELDHVAALRAQRATAIVIAGSRHGHLGRTAVDSAPGDACADGLAAALSAFRDGGGRVAVVSQQRLPASTVVVENRAGARDLAEALAGLGHRRFGVLAGPPDLMTSADRLAGFRAGLVAAGLSLPRDRVLHVPFTRDGGHAGALEVVARGWDVDCLFAVNDVMAVGAMAALRERGADVPRDLGVAGFDDIETLRDVSPALTTVRLPLEQMGRDAVELALGDGDEGAAEAGVRVRRVRGEVVLRTSTARR